jgi:hypothetical protein
MADYNSILKKHNLPSLDSAEASDNKYDAILKKYEQKPSEPVKDIVRSVGKGTLQLPGTLTGLADTPLGLMGFDRPVSKAFDTLGEKTGITPGQWAEDTKFSPGLEQARGNVDQVWDDPNTSGLDVAKAYLQNPSVIANTLAESAPSMAAGGALSRVLPLASPVVRGAIGEGAVSAGQQQANIDDSVDPQKRSLAALGTGIGVGTTGVLGGKLANRMGIGDFETSMAGNAQNKALPFTKRVPAGFATEGAEELTQSTLEQGLQNYAEDKPLGQDMARAAVEGTLAGGIMGAGFNALPQGPLTRAVGQGTTVDQAPDNVTQPEFQGPPQQANPNESLINQSPTTPFKQRPSTQQDEPVSQEQPSPYSEETLAKANGLGNLGQNTINLAVQQNVPEERVNKILDYLSKAKEQPQDGLSQEKQKRVDELTAVKDSVTDDKARKVIDADIKRTQNAKSVKQLGNLKRTSDNRLSKLVSPDVLAKIRNKPVTKEADQTTQDERSTRERTDDPTSENGIPRVGDAEIETPDTTTGSESGSDSIPSEESVRGNGEDGIGNVGESEGQELETPATPRTGGTPDAVSETADVQRAGGSKQLWESTAQEAGEDFYKNTILPDLKSELAKAKKGKDKPFGYKSKKQYIDDIKSQIDDIENGNDFIGGASLVNHYGEVRKALEEGKPVPSKVLRDYPDLEEQYGSNQQPEQINPTTPTSTEQEPTPGQSDQPANKPIQVKQTPYNEATNQIPQPTGDIQAKTQSQDSATTDKEGSGGRKDATASKDRKDNGATGKIDEQSSKTKTQRTRKKKYDDIQEQLRQVKISESDRASTRETVGFIKDEKKYKESSTIRSEFKSKHKENAAFAESLIFGDFEKASDDIHRGRIDTNNAQDILNDAEKTGLLDKSIITKVQEAIRTRTKTQPQPKNNEQSSKTETKTAEKETAKKPPILTKTKRKYISDSLREYRKRIKEETGKAPIKAAVDNERQRITGSYDEDRLKAEASLPFDEFVKLPGNEDLSNEVNRTSYDGLREEFGITDNPVQESDVSINNEAPTNPATDEATKHNESVPLADKAEQNATHIEGENIERVTPNVVDESLQEGADNTPKNKTEMRKWLIDKIDGAILDSKDSVNWLTETGEVKELALERDKVAQEYNSKVNQSNGKGQHNKDINELAREKSKLDNKINERLVAARLENNDYVTFDVPGDGKFRVLNTKPALEDFKKKVLASSGFKDTKERKGIASKSLGAPKRVIADFVEDQEWENAYQAAKLAGIDLGFGLRLDSDDVNVYIDIEYVDMPMPGSYFVGRRFNGEKWNWLVIHKESGNSVGNFESSKKKAIATAKEAIQRMVDKNGVDFVESKIKDVKGKSQPELEELFKKKHNIDDVKLSKSTKTTGSTVASIKDAIRKELKRAGNLLDSGQIEVVQSVDNINDDTVKINFTDDIEGYYNAKSNKVVIVADNVTPETIRPLLLHEILHRAESTDAKYQAALPKINAQLEPLYNAASKGRGAPIIQKAYRRVIEAKTPENDRMSEFASYLVTEYESGNKSLPSRVVKWVKDLYAAIRAVLIRAGMVPKNITPADLSALARASLKSNQGKGDDVIIKASKAGYQGNDKGEAFEWLRAKDKGLDMSKEARMERAKAMGFNVDKVWYHGTMDKNFKEFNLNANPFSRTGAPGTISFTENKSFADAHGTRVIEAFLKLKNTFDYRNESDLKKAEKFFDDYYKNEYGAKPGGNLTINAMDSVKKGSYQYIEKTIPIEWYKDNGYDSFYTFENSFNIHVLDNKVVRSIHAAFDPDFADSGNLLASSRSAGKNNYPLADKGTWYGDEDYKDRGGELKYVSPDEYINAVKPLKMSELTRENIDDLKQHILDGGKLDPLALYEDGSEDGRHRAYAAKELGIKRVPVLDFKNKFADSGNLLASIKSAGDILSDQFKRWFGQSKIKSGGKPIKFYHGSNADFTVFDDDKLASSTLHSTAQLGHFFTRDKGHAAEYGSKVHEVYLKIENPYVITSELLDKRMGDDPLVFKNKLIDKGHDGIYIKDAGYAVVFKSNQAKLTNNQAPTESSDIRYSKASPIVERLSQSEAAEKIKSAVGKSVSNLKGQRFGLLTLRQIAAVTSKVLPEIKSIFIEDIHAMNTEKTTRLSKAGEIGRDWAKLPKEVSITLSDLMHDSTVSGVDGSQKYRPVITKEEADKKIKVIREKMRGRSGDDKQLFMKQIKDINIKLAFEAKRKAAYPALKRRFDTLAKESSEAARIYNESRDYHEQHFKDTLAALKARINESQASPTVKKSLIAQLRAKFETLQVEAPYFPLARFGDFWVHTQDGDETRFNMFESEADQKRFIAQMEQEGVNVLGSGKNLEKLGEIEGVSSEFISNVDALISELGDVPMVNDLRDSVYQLYLQSLPDVSARKHFIHRKKTKGFHHDQLRAFAQKSLHDANNIAKLKFGYKLQATLDRTKDAIDIATSKVKRSQIDTETEWMQEYLESDLSMDDIKTQLRTVEDEEEYDKLKSFKKWKASYTDEGVQQLIDHNEHLVKLAENIKPDNKVFAVDALNELRKAYADIMNPQMHPLAQALNRLGFAWYLGLTPAAAVVNLTQTPVVSLPILASKVGWGIASKQMGLATKLFFKHMSVKKKNGLPWIEGASIKDELRGNEAKAYQAWLDSGLIDVTLAHDLAGLSEEGMLTNTAKHKLMNTLSFSFHHAERMNREITALAAYRSAIAKNMSHNEAVKFASDIVWDSHFDYSSSNRARFMRGNWARVLTQFKQYSQNLTYMYGRVFHKAYMGKDVPQAERDEAKRALKGLLTMQFAAAGTLGLPVVGVMMESAQMLKDIFGDDDEPEDIEGLYRQALADLVESMTGSQEAGNKASLILSKGLIDAFTPYSVSGRLGASDLWVRSSNRELEGTDKAWDWAKTLLGPMAGLLLENPAVSLDMMADGHYQRGIEHLMPKAIKDGMKAYRFSTEGVENMRGDKIKDDYDIIEGIGQIMGFSSSEISVIYDQNNAIKRVETKLNKRRQTLLSRAANARIEKDTDAYRKAMAEIKLFNEKNPKHRIGRQHIQQSVKARVRRTRQTHNGLYTSKRNSELRERYRFAG